MFNNIKSRRHSMILFFLVLYTMIFGSIMYKSLFFFYGILLLITIFFFMKSKNLILLINKRNIIFFLLVYLNILIGMLYILINKDNDYIINFYEKSYFIHQNFRYFLFLIYSLFIVYLLLQNDIVYNFRILSRLYYIHLSIGLLQHICAIFNVLPTFSQKYGYREFYVFSGYRVDGFSLEATGYASVLISLFICKLIYNHLINKKVSFLTYFSFLYLLLYTFSRGAWVSLLIGLILSYFLFYRKEKKMRISYLFTWYLLILGISVLLVCFFSNISQALDDLKSFYLVEFQDENYSQYEFSRPRLFALSFEAFYTNPLFGVGSGNLHKFISWKYNQYGTWGAINEYIQVLSENGIVGLILFMIFILAPIVQSFILKIKISVEHYKIFILIVTLYISNLALGFTINLLYNPIFWFSNSLIVYILFLYRGYSQKIRK
ncbi:O-antigen ligase family protein [Priestia megaterium]|uniref:O-antigen ligase family protein n=1 Tax=Priestia megaterium TaxID=1404 RepID=UPI000BF7542D|nr:O-antigen ligase family protein [Priestia megaterium]PFD99355.1 hypothetical protein CN265_12420 [Priestia megaterium]